MDVEFALIQELKHMASDLVGTLFCSQSHVDEHVEDSCELRGDHTKAHWQPFRPDQPVFCVVVVYRLWSSARSLSVIVWYDIRVSRMKSKDRFLKTYFQAFLPTPGTETFDHVLGVLKGGTEAIVHGKAR